MPRKISKAFCGDAGLTPTFRTPSLSLTLRDQAQAREAVGNEAIAVRVPLDGRRELNALPLRLARSDPATIRCRGAVGRSRPGPERTSVGDSAWPTPPPFVLSVGRGAVIFPRLLRDCCRCGPGGGAGPGGGHVSARPIFQDSLPQMALRSLTSSSRCRLIASSSFKSVALASLRRPRSWLQALPT